MQLGQSQQWAEDRYGEIGSGDAEQMIDAATEIVKALKARGDDAFADWLKDSVGGLRVTSPDVPKALLDLDVPVVTTNYDTLLEQAKKARLGGPHRPPATWLEHYRVLEVLRRREDSVAHLHGCWKDPLSVVLDRESYAKIGKHEGFQYIAQAAWGLLPLLFVGVGEGMGDPNFRRLWSAIGEVWGKRDIGSRFWLRCEYERSWSAAQEESLSDRVQVVEYGPKYDSLAGFLEDLGEKRRARVEQARLVMDQLGDRPVDVAARCVVAVRRFNDEIVARLVKGHLGPVAKVPTAAHVARALGSLVAPLKEHERRHRRTASSAKRPPSTWEWSSDYVRGKLEEAMLP